MSIFISYSRKDSSFAERIVRSLQSEGYSVWFDIHNIPSGVQFTAAIDQAISNADNIIVILSPDSVESQWVQREILHASSKNKRIIPIMCRSTPLPVWINDINYIDFTKNYSSALNRLLADLPPSNQPSSMRTDKLNGITAIVGIVILVVILFVAVLLFKSQDGMQFELTTVTSTYSYSPIIPENSFSQPPIRVSPTNLPTQSIETYENKEPFNLTPVVTEKTFPTETLASPKHISLIYEGQDGLTLLFTGIVDVSELVLYANDRTHKLIDDFPVLVAIGTYVEDTMCFRYMSGNAQLPLARDCNPQKTFVLNIALADIFWYDSARRLLLDVIVKNGQEIIGYCPASNIRCDF